MTYALYMAVCRLLLYIKFNREVTQQENCRQRRQTSNVRLPLELRSDRRETSATRVSDDLQLSIFRRWKKQIGKIFGSKNQIFVQFGLNFTYNSTSILRTIRPQLYVQFDLNFTSNSTSILRPIRPQFYVQFDLNFSVVWCLYKPKQSSKRHTAIYCFPHTAVILICPLSTIN